MSLQENDPETIARATLSLLEIRLRRLEFLLTGEVSTGDQSNASTLARENETVQQTKREDTVTGRLQKLQSDLDGLRKLRGPAGDVVRDVESLHSKAPEIFPTPWLNETTSPTSTTLSVATSTASPSTTVGTNPRTTTYNTINNHIQKSSTILAQAPLYPRTASQLSSLQTLQIPTASSSSTLVALQPRITAALQKQRDLENEAADLHDRSARCLEWWVDVGVVGMGEVWEDWESRVSQVGMDLKRLERGREEMVGYL